MTVARRTLRHWCVVFDKPRSFFLRFDVLSLDVPAVGEPGSEGAASDSPGDTQAG
jgi:hypothetical protein